MLEQQLPGGSSIGDMGGNGMSLLWCKLLLSVLPNAHKLFTTVWKLLNELGPRSPTRSCSRVGRFVSNLDSIGLWQIILHSLVLLCTLTEGQNVFSWLNATSIFSSCLGSVLLIAKRKALGRLYCELPSLACENCCGRVKILACEFSKRAVMT